MQTSASLWLTIPGQDQGVLQEHKLIQKYWPIGIPGIEFKMKSDEIQERPLIFGLFCPLFFSSFSFFIMNSPNLMVLFFPQLGNTLLFTSIFEITATFSDQMCRFIILAYLHS